jgi:hypothetical protein
VLFVSNYKSFTDKEFFTVQYIIDFLTRLVSKIRNMTKSAIVAKYITELDSVNVKIESMDSLLVGFALILCIAKVAKFFASFFVLKKLMLVKDQPVRRPLPVRLVFVVDAPINKRLLPLEVIHDAPTSRRKPTPDEVKSMVENPAYKAFCQENREYVKNWKEEQIKRQLFEMWHALGSHGQKEWLHKADALNKLFEMTNKSDFYKGTVTPKYPRTELCKLLSGCQSGNDFFNREIQLFKLFYQNYMDTDP